MLRCFGGREIFTRENTNLSGDAKEYFWNSLGYVFKGPREFLTVVVSYGYQDMPGLKEPLPLALFVQLTPATPNGTDGGLTGARLHQAL